MEEKRDGEADFSGESPPIASVSPENLPTSVATPISSTVNGNLGISYDQPTIESTSDTEANRKDLDGKLSSGEVHKHELVVPDSQQTIQQKVPEVSSLADNTSTVEILSNKTEQGESVDDPNTLARDDSPCASEPNEPIATETISVLEETSAFMSSVAVTLGSDVLLEASKEGEEILRLGNSPSVGIANAAVQSNISAPIVPSIGAVAGVPADSLEPSAKEVAEISQLGDAPLVSAFDNSVHSDSSAAVNMTKAEVKPPISLAELKKQKNADLVKQNKPKPAKSEKKEKRVNTNRGFVDTAAPFESVKEAVTMFGGIVDWKAHRAQALERRKHVLSELEKIQKEIPEYKKQSEVAEKAKAELLTELDNTKKTIEELKVNLERAQTEEAQAKQDSELAELRVKEIEQGIVGESSIAVKTQQEVAKARHVAAIAELKSVREELKVLQDNYVLLINERDMALRKSEEAASLLKEMEKTVEDLTLELITIKESLELAQTSHLEAEEHRMGSSLASDHDFLAWQEELKQANDEVQRLTQQLSSTKDVKAKLDTTSSLLVNLKSELAAYMEAKQNQESCKIVEEKTTDDVVHTTESQTSLQELALTRDEYEKVKTLIEKAKEEINCLKVVASSLKSELDKERRSLNNLQQREGMASIAVSSLEAELDRTKKELEVVRMKEKEAREKMVELPKLLQQAAQEADEAKSAAQVAQEELRNAQELAEQVKASASMTEIRLQAALKEIEAAKASERLALSAIKALEESEYTDSAADDSSSGVTLPLAEYFNISKKAHEAEELAHETVTAALAQVEEAKQSELKCLQKLEEGYKDLSYHKEALTVAKEKAEKAKEGKLAAEQELRKWRAESQERRKAAVNPMQDSNIKSFNKQETDVFVPPVHDTSSFTSEESSPGNNVSKDKIRRRRSFFPRILLYLAKRTRQQRSNGHT